MKTIGKEKSKQNSPQEQSKPRVLKLTAEPRSKNSGPKPVHKPKIMGSEKSKNKSMGV